MKRNKTKKVAVLGMVAAMAVTAGVFAACDGGPEVKKDLSVTVSGAQNGAVSATYSGAPIEVKYASEQDVAFAVTYVGTDGTVYEESATAPTDAGKYTVSITYAGDETYNPYSLEVTLVIAKAENIFTVTIAGYVFGGTVSQPVVTGNKGGELSFVYEGTGVTDYETSATAPTEAGTYRVTATAAATENYLAGSATAAFEITLPPRTDVPTEAPVLDSSVKVLNDCFRIVPEADTEYRVVDEDGAAVSDWQTEAEFTGLKQNTTYFVEARRSADAEHSASAAGEKKLEVKTMKGGLLEDFERRTNGEGMGNFIASTEQAHSGTFSLKTRQKDGGGYILHPQFLVERDDNGNPYGGYWQEGSFDHNWVDLTGYRYLSFWIYFEKNTESVTFNGGTLEIWNGNDVFNCWLGEKTIPCGSWQRIVVDMTKTEVLRGDFDGILEQITKIYLNFNPYGIGGYDVEEQIGTFYLDDIEALADVELEERELVVTGEESGAINAVYTGSPITLTVTKPLGGGTLSITYAGIDGTDYAGSQTAPTGVGKYAVSITLTGNAFYRVPVKEATLVIAKAANEFTVTMEDFRFGETATQPVVTGNMGGNVTFTYEGTGETEYGPSETVPSAVGTYKVTATVAATENYLAGTASAEFMIVSAPRTDVPTEAPALDPAALVLDDGFTLAAEDDTEYRVIDVSGEEAAVWQKDAAFTGLEPNTTYTVQARRPAKNGQAPSAAGEQTLKVKTAERFVLDDFEKKSVGDTSCGSFIVSDEKSHGGVSSMKTGAPDGAYGYILQPNSLLDSGNGYWEAGDYAQNFIDLTGYRYLSFWIYFDSEADSVTFGAGGYTIEIWKENYGDVFTCWLGAQTYTTGKWHRVVIDLTENSICKGTYEEILAHIAKIYINFNPTQASDIGTFYLDDIVLLKDEEA